MTLYLLIFLNRDFRKEYNNLTRLRTPLSEVPVLRLTATATPEMVESILQMLRIKKNEVRSKEKYQTGKNMLISNVNDLT